MGKSTFEKFCDIGSEIVRNLDRSLDLLGGVVGYSGTDEGEFADCVNAYVFMSEYVLDSDHVMELYDIL